MLDTFRIAFGLVLVDRWPERAARARVWRVVGKDAFDYRWHERPVPPRIDAVRAALDRAVRHTVIRHATEAHRRVITEQVERLDAPLAHVNVGPGRRKENDLFVVLAVDLCLEGASSVAMSWEHNDIDPAAFVDLAEAFGCPLGPTPATTPEDAKNIVRGWGDGAKGIVTLREPGGAHLRMFNVVNNNGEPDFLDYRDVPQTLLITTRSARAGAQRRAHESLNHYDSRSAFASLKVWRTRDQQNALGIPDDFYSYPRPARRELVRDVVERGIDCEGAGAGVPDVAYDQLFNMIDLLDDVSAVRWLVRNTQRGACTLLPTAYQQLVDGEDSPIPITAADSAIIALVQNGRALFGGGLFEITVANTDANRAMAAQFPRATIRSGRVDGLPDGYFEVRIDHEDRQRTLLGHACYEPPMQTTRNVDAQPRGWSWIETNRVQTPGLRTTNCWNTAAALANYLSTTAVSSSLPIYRDAPLRPSIRAYLDLLDARDPVFVTTQAEAEHVAKQWGPGQHGIVSAALNNESTHMFNVVSGNTGVRFLDGHLGVPGDYNFDIRWQRIGVSQIGELNEYFLGCENRPDHTAEGNCD